MIGIIGGTGLTRLTALELDRREVVRTPYGEPSSTLAFGRLGGGRVVFLARHGYGHTLLPHRVNYRANMWALKESGATKVLAVASVGGIQADLMTGALVIPHQILDYTWGRENTYCEGEVPVRHVDFTRPYDEALRKNLLDAARVVGEPVGDGGVYACTQGPRLETAAEIDRFERDGAHLVGMTAMPEAVLARELDLPYAAINVVVNAAAGRADSACSVRFADMQALLAETMPRVLRILEQCCRACGEA